MTTRILTSFIAVVALVALAGVSGKATSAELTNSLTFNRPVALPGVTLPAGTYLFERFEGWANVVRVTEAKTRRPLYMGFTDPVRRPHTLQADQLVVLGEAPRGEPARVAIWFPIGRRDGHRFIY
jgi:hypothetical protein